MNKIRFISRFWVTRWGNRIDPNRLDIVVADIPAGSYFNQDGEGAIMECYFCNDGIVRRSGGWNDYSIGNSEIVRALNGYPLESSADKLKGDIEDWYQRREIEYRKMDAEERT